MSGKTRKRSLAESLKALNDSAVNAGPAATASYSLIGAIVVFAGLGYGLDVWLGTAPGFLLGGIVVALIVGFAQLAVVMLTKRK
ncbi:MAG: AtpZ/AtpI family protein [Vicinamibacterales bacterium]